MTFTLLYREYCSLCKIMLEQLKNLQTQYHFHIDIKDIDDCSELLPQYDELVPVLLNHQGQEICHWHFDEHAFLKEL